MEPISSPAPLAALAPEGAPHEPAGAEATDFASILAVGLYADPAGTTGPAQPAADAPAHESHGVAGDAASPDLAALIAALAIAPASPRGDAAPAAEAAQLDGAVADVAQGWFEDNAAGIAPKARPAPASATNNVPEIGGSGSESGPRAQSETSHLSEPQDVRSPAGPDRALPPGVERAADVVAASTQAPPVAAPVSAHTAAQAPARLEVAAPVATPAWHAEFSQQVVWMATERRQVAELRLNPPELGPVEIRLAVSAGSANEASVQFISAHAPVREAIEAALPRLREMLAGAGVALGQATVGSEFPAGGQSAPDRGPRGSPGVAAPGEIGASPSARATTSANRLVDIFA